MSKHKDIKEILAGWDGFDRPSPGDVFEHYKGDLFTVVETGFLEDAEAPCVVYKSQKLDIVWVRTAKNFFEEIEHQGVKRGRFSHVS